MQTTTTAIDLILRACKRVEARALIVGVVVLITFILVNNPSTGIIRGGDDDGSGVGGTGRSLNPGGSGLGGTGLKPFIGLSIENEIQILNSIEQQGSAISESIRADFEPSRTIIPTPIEPQFALATNSTTPRNSSAIPIDESIQRSADENALYFQQLQQLSTRQNFVGYYLESTSKPGEFKTINTELNHNITDNIYDTISILNSSQASTTATLAPATNDNQVTWGSVLRFLAKNVKNPAQLVNPVLEEIIVKADGSDSALRPVRVARPELPPVQRLRPMQRPSILPPRIQPFRL
ncbi:MAG: hypothetical protein COA96_00930 [SAR86 cluster bacterium]|uniref:Uncharacterized protein n=1 Tax=SAR86 cluster bacterium TaxID=2030880 RepID=A0A2A5BA89_9GAMM|nr:MAG: hypothetical protein COA96_00930 [SAR86 cluster bacterium]